MSGAYSVQSHDGDVVVPVADPYSAEDPLIMDDPSQAQEEHKPRCQCKGCGTRCVARVKAWTWKTWLRLFVILLLVVAIIMVAVFFRKPVKKGLSKFLDWLKGVGFWGPIVMALVYILATVFFVPGLILTLGAGFALGILWGTISVSIGSTLGACLAFLLGRTLVREWIEEKIQTYKTFAAVDLAIARQGWFIVFLIRLSPVLPFNVMNYALALTKVKFWHYALASWIGMLPGTVMYVYIGSAAGSVASIIAGDYHGGTKAKILFYVGLAAAVVVVIVITIIAKKAITRALQEAQDAEDEKHAAEDGDCCSSEDEPHDGGDPQAFKKQDSVMYPPIGEETDPLLS